VKRIRSILVLAERAGIADPQLGMALAQVVSHRRRLGVPHAIHDEPHRAAFVGDREAGAAVEHESTLLAFRVRR
jgi:hypothetical protein